MVISVFLIILFIMLLLFEKLIRKWLGVEKKQISETGKIIERWGRRIIVVIYLCSWPFIISMDDDVTKLYWMFFLTLLLGFHSFVQWKYTENSREYLVTLILLILCLIIMYNIDYILDFT